MNVYARPSPTLPLSVTGKTCPSTGGATSFVVSEKKNKQTHKREKGKFCYGIAETLRQVVIMHFNASDGRVAC